MEACAHEGPSGSLPRTPKEESFFSLSSPPGRRSVSSAADTVRRTNPGTLDDVMLGVATREDSSDLSRAAVLSTLQTPTPADPFKSVAVKWTELDVQLKSMGLVKNHDCVYVEATDIQHLPSGERVGYQLQHSVDIQEAHKLPGRVRAHLSVCSFFRQVTDSLVFVYTLGMMEPMSDRTRRVVLPHFVNTLLSTFKRAASPRPSSLAETFGRRYSDFRGQEDNCVTCSQRARRRTSSACNVCSKCVCGSCKVVTEPSFMTPELDMVQREVVFCSACANEEDVSDFFVQRLRVCYATAERVLSHRWIMFVVLLVTRRGL